MFRTDAVHHIFFVTVGKTKCLIKTPTMLIELRQSDSDLFSWWLMENVICTSYVWMCINKIVKQNLNVLWCLISVEEIRRRWGGIGHTLWKPSYITSQALSWNPQGRQKRRHQRNTWRLELEADTKRSGMGWNKIEKTEQSVIEMSRWWPMLPG